MCLKHTPSAVNGQLVLGEVLGFIFTTERVVNGDFVAVASANLVGNLYSAWTMNDRMNKWRNEHGKERARWRKRERDALSVRMLLHGKSWGQKHRRVQNENQ